VQQVRIQLALRVPDGCDAAAYHEDLKTSFLESYAKKNEWLQISLQGLGTPTWQLQGQAKLEKAIRHSSARTRIRDIFKKCHDGLGLSPPVNQAYSKYLETALVVKPDAEPLSGERRWWRTAAPAAGPALLPAAAAGAPVAAPPRAPGASAAPGPGRGAAAPPATARAASGGGSTRAAPAWAFSARRCVAGGPCTAGGCGCGAAGAAAPPRPASGGEPPAPSAAPAAGPAARPSVLVPGSAPVAAGAAQPDAYSLREPLGTYPSAARTLPYAAAVAGPFAGIHCSDKALQNGKLRHRMHFWCIWRHKITESDAHSEPDHLVLPGPTQKNLCCRRTGAWMKQGQTLRPGSGAYVQVISQPQTRGATQRYRLVIK